MDSFAPYRGFHTSCAQADRLRSRFLRSRFRIDKSNNIYCHTLAPGDSIRFRAFGAGTVVSATARHHGGTTMPRCGTDQAVPRAPHARGLAPQLPVGTSSRRNSRPVSSIN